MWNWRRIRMRGQTLQDDWGSVVSTKVGACKYCQWCVHVKSCWTQEMQEEVDLLLINDKAGYNSPLSFNRLHVQRRRAAPGLAWAAILDVATRELSADDAASSFFQDLLSPTLSAFQARNFCTDSANLQCFSSPESGWEKAFSPSVTTARNSEAFKCVVLTFKMKDWCLRINNLFCLCV